MKCFYIAAKELHCKSDKNSVSLQGRACKLTLFLL